MLSVKGRLLGYGDNFTASSNVADGVLSIRIDHNDCPEFWLEIAVPLVNKWKDVKGYFSTHVTMQDSKLFDDELAKQFESYLKNENGTLTFNFTSTGQSPIWDEWEGDEERVIDYVTINGELLPSDLSDRLFEQYQVDIYGVVL